VIKPIILASSAMPKSDKYDKLRAQLAQMASGANTSCKDFTDLLEKFGFVIRDCGSPGHKVATHPAIQMSIADSANYNCGHNPKNKLLPVYIKKFYRITTSYEITLREYLK
jgi:hypothetical protein